MKRLITRKLLGIFAASIAILALLKYWLPDLKLGPEIAKAVLQLGVVAIVGSFVSLLLFEYQREKGLADKQRDMDRQSAEKERDLERARAEKRRDMLVRKVEYREQLLMLVLSKALAAYSQAKKARRLMRARAVARSGESEVLLVEGYDQYMELVNDAQLELENLARDVKTSSVAFSKPDEIVQSLEKMEAHLGELIGEYERKRPLFLDDVPHRPLGDHPLLEDFLRRAKDSKFSTEVVHPYHEVQATIRADLLHPQVPTAGEDA